MAGRLNTSRTSIRQILKDSNILPYCEGLPLNTYKGMFFQQDGAPPHCTHLAKNWLREQFGRQWISRGGPIEWPARSPDLSPLDFFLWGHIKQVVYQTSVTSVTELERRIQEACAGVTQSCLENVWRNVAKRVALCEREEGKHFEQFL